MLAAVIVGGVVVAIAFEQLIEGGTIGIMRHDQRLDLGAQEVVRAGCAERRQGAQLL